ncbi:hypothetical protein KC352_g38721, partial [Hortaea werneckii]
RQTPPNDRNTSNVFAVNAISFHPQHGTFSTAGSDGTFHFWDKDAKHRLKGYPEVGGSIVATDFNKGGNIFAYAVSYDWSKGYQGNSQQYPNKIMLHPIVGDECDTSSTSKPPQPIDTMADVEDKREDEQLDRAPEEEEAGDEEEIAAMKKRV